MRATPVQWLRGLTLAGLAVASAACGSMYDARGVTEIRSCAGDGCAVTQDAVRVDVPEGALAERITVRVDEDPSAPPGSIGPAWLVTPDDVQFMVPSALPRVAFVLAALELPPGTDVTKLAVARAQDGAWVVVPEPANGLADANAVVAAHVGQFGTFGLIPVGGPEPAPEVMLAEGASHNADAGGATLLPPAPTRGSLHGTLTGDRGPVGGASVDLTQDAELRAHTESNADGTFDLADVPAGEYGIAITAEGFDPISRFVTVTAGAQATADFTLNPKPGAVEGKVVDAAHHTPVEGAAMTLLLGSAVAGQAVSDSEGRYRIAASPGAYKLRAQAEGFAVALVDVAVARDATTPLDVNLEPVAVPGAGLRGNVVDTLGVAVAGARLELTPSGGGAPTSVTSAADGAYEFSGLPPGAYHLAVTEPDHAPFDGDLTLPAGVVTELDVRMDPLVANVNGVVRDPLDAPLGGAAVSLLRGETLVASKSTDASGAYRLLGIAAGTYRMTVQLAGYLPFERTLHVPGGTTVVDVKLQKNGGFLFGTVTDRGTGAAIAGVHVRILDATRAELFATDADASGQYTTPDLPEAQTIVRFEHPSYQPLERQVIPMAPSTRVDGALAP